MKFEIQPFQKLFSTESKNSELTSLVAHTHFYSPLNVEYEIEYGQHEFQDLSFALFSLETPVIGVALTKKNDALSFFNRPVSLFIASNISEENIFEAKIAFFQKMEELIKDHQIKKMSFFDHPLLNNYFFDQIQGHTIWLNSTIDLNSSESTILKNIRKSYRSLINWGEREIKIVRVDQMNPDIDLFEKFRAFHIGVSGKETRSKKTWDLQFEMIKTGKAFLDLGFLQNQLVSGSLILYGTSEAYYGVAVNDRKLMGSNKSLGHSTLYRSIILAKSLGLKIFNLSSIYYPGMNEKEKHIAVFKKGFSSNVESSLIIKVEFP